MERRRGAHPFPHPFCQPQGQFHFSGALIAWSLPGRLLSLINGGVRISEKDEALQPEHGWRIELRELEFLRNDQMQPLKLPLFCTPAIQTYLHTVGVRYTVEAEQPYLSNKPLLIVLECSREDLARHGLDGSIKVAAPKAFE